MKCWAALAVSFLLVVIGCRADAASQPATATPQLKPLTNSVSWTVSASSQEATFSAAMAVDGDPSTRWSSGFKDDQWWMVDFGQPEMLGKLTLNWEDAFPKAYNVLVSPDGTQWEPVYSEKKGRAGTTEVRFAPKPVRMVKIECVKRGTEWGFSLREAEFNTPDPVKVDATSSSGTGDYAPEFAVDGKPDTRWSSNFNDQEWWMGRFEQPIRLAGMKILWETAFSEKYEVLVSMDGRDWKKVYDVPEGDGRTDLVFFKPVEAQYVKINCLQRGTGWGNSIYEITFYDENTKPVVTASSAQDSAEPAMALDGESSTQWHSAPGDVQDLTVKLPARMSLGGVELTWGDDYASAYEIALSADASQWNTVFRTTEGNGAKDYVFFPSADARYVKINCLDGPSDQGFAIADMEFKGGEEQATPIRAYQSKAKDSTPGWFPMWLTRQQEFWTVVGVVGDSEETIVGETGAIEPRKGGFCVMPFVLTGGQLISYPAVKLEQTLEGEILPLPAVHWLADNWRMDISCVAFGEPGKSLTAVRYRFTNTGAAPFSGKLALAVRPVTLNPFWQFGGMSPMKKTECVEGTHGAILQVDGRPKLVSLTAPQAMGAAPLGDGDAADFLAKGTVPPSKKAEDAEGKTSAALVYDLNLEPGASREVVVVLPIHDNTLIPSELESDPEAGFRQVLDTQKAAWAELLRRPEIDIPEKRLIQVMKSNVGYVLVNRDEPWFKPGPRNYNHGWLRDAAMTGSAMLRMGRPELVKTFLESFSKFVGESGWVPFMIMEDGKPCGFNPNLEAGEGQEFDSQGEYVFIVRQYYDYTQDRELLRRVYPSVVRALKFGKELRRLRMTDEYKNDPVKKAYYGLLPKSNSHEGYYPAKTSYWDDFWMVRGFKDGAHLAAALGETKDAAWMKAEETDLRKCLYSSILQVIKRGSMSIIPGCVELGDVDPTSTTVAIMACDEEASLPEPYGTNTFIFYYTNFTKRLKPGGEELYTPYEARNADVLIRIGRREEALTALRYFASQGTRPYNWNEMAEVIHPRLRAASYIGDMPHTWVGSDYINAVRSIFAFEKGDALVVGAGLDPKWFAEGVTVKELPTQYGLVTYTVKANGDEIAWSFSGKAAPPGGFIVPLPESMQSLAAEVNGTAAVVANGGVAFRQLPTEMRLSPVKP